MSYAWNDLFVTSPAHAGTVSAVSFCFTIYFACTNFYANCFTNKYFVTFVYVKSAIAPTSSEDCSQSAPNVVIDFVPKPSFTVESRTMNDERNLMVDRPSIQTE